MTKEELLERYEALGAERDFLEAKAQYETALASCPDARCLNDYAYLLECHGRNELRRAVEHYERAVELDPDYEKPRYQLIQVRANLGEPDLAIADYERRLRASPRDVREFRFLASAYLHARAYEKARTVIERGLDLMPDDARLLALRGEARAGVGDVEGALADWRRAVELDPSDIGALFSSAFLLEREGRLANAAQAWRSILEWNEARGYTLQTEWPRHELARLLTG